MAFVGEVEKAALNGTTLLGWRKRDPSSDDARKRLDKERTLTGLDPRLQRLRNIIRLHSNDGLGDDVTGVVVGVHKVNCHPCLNFTGLENRFVDVESPHALAAEARQQSRVDVHDPPAELL